MDLEKKFLSDFLSDLNANRVVLPTLPEVAMQVRKVVGDPQTNAANIDYEVIFPYLANYTANRSDHAFPETNDS